MSPSQPGGGAGKNRGGNEKEVRGRSENLLASGLWSRRGEGDGFADGFYRVIGIERKALDGDVAPSLPCGSAFLNDGGLGRVANFRCGRCAAIGRIGEEGGLLLGGHRHSRNNYESHLEDLIC